MTESPYELRPHQLEALHKLSNGKILWGGVGSGKSFVAATYYKEKEAPKLVYVITTAKKRDSFDWREEFYRVGVGPVEGPFIDPPRKGRGRGRRTRSENLLVGRPDGVVSWTSEEVLCGRGPEGGRGTTEADGSVSLSSEHGNLAEERRGGQARGSSPVRRDGIGGIDSSGDVSEVVSGPGRAGIINGSNNLRNDACKRRCESCEASNSHLGFASEGKDFQNQSTGINSVGGKYPWVLTVDSWNNIGKYENVKDAFFIFDEQRLVGSGQWVQKFLKITKSNNWILLSATPGDTWMDYIPVFVANNFYKNRTEFKREHVVYNTFTKFPKVDRYINVGRLLRQRSQLLVEMPYERYTKRNVVEVPLKYDKEALEMVLKKRWHIYENRPLRDIAEMFLVGRKLVNGDPSRLEMVKELWRNHPKLIVFYNFNFELEILRSLSGVSCEVCQMETGISTRTESSGNGSSISTQISTHGTKWTPISSDTYHPPGSVTSTKFPKTSISTLSEIGQPSTSETGDTGHTRRCLECSKRPHIVHTDPLTTTESFEIAEWNGHKHEPIPSTDRWLYLVQYTAGAEGWNCIDTDAMIMYSRNYSWKIYEQAQGRIDRLNTPFRDLWYYDFTTDSFIDRAIGRSLRAKETFNEAKYMKMFS